MKLENEFKMEFLLELISVCDVDTVVDLFLSEFAGSSSTCILLENIVANAKTVWPRLSKAKLSRFPPVNSFSTLRLGSDGAVLFWCPSDEDEVEELVLVFSGIISRVGDTFGGVNEEIDVFGVENVNWGGAWYVLHDLYWCGGECNGVWYVDWADPCE